MPAFAEDATGVTAKTAKLRRRVAEYCLEKMSGVNATDKTCKFAASGGPSIHVPTHPKKRRY